MIKDNYISLFLIRHMTKLINIISVHVSLTNILRDKQYQLII